MQIAYAHHNTTNLQNGELTRPAFGIAWPTFVYYWHLNSTIGSTDVICRKGEPYLMIFHLHRVREHKYCQKNDKLLYFDCVGNGANVDK